MSPAAPLLDRRRLRRAVLATLVLAVPPLVIVRAVKGGDLTGRESNLWVVAVVVALVAFAVGGFVAAHGTSDLPMSHSAAAATYAFGVMTVGSIVAALIGGNDIRSGVVLSVALLGALCVCAAVLGGYGAVWWGDRVRNKGVP